MIRMNIMKKLHIAAALPLCFALLAACGKRADINCTELAARLNSEVSFAEPLTELDAAGAEQYFNLNPNGYTEVAAYVGTKSVCDEFVIVKTDSPSNVSSKLKTHIEKLKTEYSEYRPAEAAKLDNAVLETYEGAVVMIIAPDGAQAKTVYENYLKK